MYFHFPSSLIKYLSTSIISDIFFEIIVASIFNISYRLDYLRHKAEVAGDNCVLFIIYYCQQLSLGWFKKCGPKGKGLSTYEISRTN